MRPLLLLFTLITLVFLPSCDKESECPLEDKNGALNVCIDGQWQCPLGPGQPFFLQEGGCTAVEEGEYFSTDVMAPCFADLVIPQKLFKFDTTDANPRYNYKLYSFGEPGVMPITYHKVDGRDSIWRAYSDFQPVCLGASGNDSLGFAFGAVRESPDAVRATIYEYDLRTQLPKLLPASEAKRTYTVILELLTSD